MAAKKKGDGMTPAHKAALERGRRERRIVSAYLEALRASKPKRGRKRTSDSVKRQLTAVVKQLTDGVANPAAELVLIQRKLDLTAELASIGAPKKDIRELEAAFCKVAVSFSRRRGISRAAWLEVGVPAVVIKRAGITK